MKCTIRHSLIAQSACGVMPRNSTSCGRKAPVAERNSANEPERNSTKPVSDKSGHPLPIRRARNPSPGSEQELVWLDPVSFKVGVESSGKFGPVVMRHLRIEVVLQIV